jgi:hypothetical protein
VSGCWDNVGFSQAVWGNTIIEVIGVIEDGVGADMEVLGGTEQYEGHVGMYGTCRAGGGHGWKQKSFDTKYQHRPRALLRHRVRSVDTAELWLYQRKTGAEKKVDVVTSK